jgi:predicted RNA binding protein YcfA (HicA-like mRNA interferase family)
MTVAFDRETIVGLLHARGWRESSTSARHIAFTSRDGGRVVILPLGVAQIADGVYRTILSVADDAPVATHPDTGAALARLDALFARHPVDEEPTAAVRAERDAR